MTISPISPATPFSESYFRLAGEEERRGRLDRALRMLGRAHQDPYRDAMRSVAASGMERLLQKAAGRARAAHWPAKPLFEGGRSPTTVNSDSKAVDIGPLVTLTTISTRIDRVGKTIEHVLRQSLKPHSINLYVSEEPYLLDKGIDVQSEHLRRIADLGANVYITPNIGPYRKQYPIVHQLKSASASPETLIVTMDDDVLYPPEALERLVAVARAHDAVVAHRGREISFDNQTLAPYRQFGAPTAVSSHRNLATGRNGIAYRLKHFPDDPGEYVGPWLAPTADDIWCKWVTGIRCVPTTILELRAAYDPRLDFPESAPADKTGLFHAYNAKGTNDDAMLSMEDFFFFHRGVNLCSLHA